MPAPQTGIDWLQATEGQRAGLYRVIKAIADLTGLDWDTLYQEALGQRLHVGTDYEANFRKGRIDRKKAARLYAWACHHHYAIGSGIAPDLFPLRDQPDPLRRWQHLIHTRAQLGAFRLVQLTDNATRLEIVRRAQAPDMTVPTLRLGDLFCFECDGAAAGSSPVAAIGFQCAGSPGWPVPIALGTDDQACVCALPPDQGLLPPLNADGTPSPLQEFDTTGIHHFILCVGPPDIITRLSGDLALGIPVTGTALSALTTSLIDAVTLHRQTVCFRSA